MRFHEILLEGKWWENTPTITLYHGTSSALLDDIMQHGIRPPARELEAYARDVLESYIPRDQWTPELLKEVAERCLRIRYSVRDPDNRDHIYLCPGSESPEGYARSYAVHGGEIAYTVWQAANYYARRDELDQLTAREFAANPVFKPRFQHAKPIVLRVEIPREWAIFRQDIHRVFNILQKGWMEKKSQYINEFDSLEDLAQDTLQNVEVRVFHTIPPSMIVDVREVEPERIDEAYDRDFIKSLRFTHTPKESDFMTELTSTGEQAKYGIIHAYLGDEEIGFLRIGPARDWDNEFPSTHTYSAELVTVDDEYQRHGVATALYDYAHKIGYRPITADQKQSRAASAMWEKNRMKSFRFGHPMRKNSHHWKPTKRR